MNSLNLLPKEAVAAQRKHPLAYISLLFAMLLPMVAGIMGLGMFLNRLFPVPGGLVIVAGACVFLLLIPVLMCFGAACWLVAARRIVPRSVAEAFCVHPGFGILSRVSKWIFEAVYGQQDAKRYAQPSDQPNAGTTPRRLS